MRVTLMSIWKIMQVSFFKEYPRLLRFVVLFWVTSLFSIRIDNEKALELDNRIISSYFSLISIWKYCSKMQQNVLLHSGMIIPNILVSNLKVVLENTLKFSELISSLDNIFCWQPQMLGWIQATMQQNTNISSLYLCAKINPFL